MIDDEHLNRHKNPRIKETLKWRVCDLCVVVISYFHCILQLNT